MNSSSHTDFLVHQTMDDPGYQQDMVANLPKDVPSLVKLVQNALVHQHIAGWVYGLAFDTIRTKEPWMRRVDEKLRWLKGYGYMAWNLMLDANALLGQPFQAWDRWGTYLGRPVETWQPQDYKTFDALAVATEQGTATLVHFFDENPGLRIPADWSQVVNSDAEWRRSHLPSPVLF